MTLKIAFVSQDEWNRSLVNCYLRNEEEITKPLIDETSAVYKSGLRIVSTKIHQLACPFRQRFVTDKGIVLIVALATLVTTYEIIILLPNQSNSFYNLCIFYKVIT